MSALLPINMMTMSGLPLLRASSSHLEM